MNPALFSIYQYYTYCARDCRQAVLSVHFQVKLTFIPSLTEIFMRATHQYDFAIVGAGLTGVALAYGLARLGRSVVVLERLEKSKILNKPSHGLIWAQANLGLPAVQREWNNLALSRWNEFDAQLCQISASTTHFERPGGVWLALDKLALQGRQLQAEAGANEDPELEWLDTETLKRLVHSLGDGIAGASYCADDGQLNLQLLHRSLSRALSNLNVDQLFLSAVERLQDTGDNYRIVGEGINVCANQVVLATGGQSDELVQSLGFESLRTVIDTFWETAQVRHFLPFPAWQLRQSRDGSLLIPVGEEGERSENWNTSLAAYPPLQQLDIRRHWHDTRCKTANALPRYQRSTTHSGVFRIASPDSLLHCSLHSSLVPAWLVGKLPDKAMAPFTNNITQDNEMAASSIGGHVAEFSGLLHQNFEI